MRTTIIVLALALVGGCERRTPPTPAAPLPKQVCCQTDGTICTPIAAGKCVSLTCPGVVTTVCATKDTFTVFTR
jgi:hypothetical protein